MWAEPTTADWREFDSTQATPLIESLPIDAEGSAWIAMGRDGSVVIDVPEGEAASVHLGEFLIEGMESKAYAIQLLVDHKVSGQPAYFEMWTSLESGGRFFSKTLSKCGPMGRLAGSAVGRDVLIPASLQGSSDVATSADLSLVLPSGGRVTIHKARMLDLPDALTFANAVEGQWYPSWFGGVIGSIFGISCGCLGAFFAYSHRTGLGWNVMQHFPLAFGVLSACILLAGITGIVIKQPYHVWYPLVLIGALGVLLAPALRWQTELMFPKNATSFDDRQMQAMDV